jgi:arsenate reductase
MSGRIALRFGSSNIREICLQKLISVLFVSRENAVRSILAEACLNKLGKGRFKAFSCGVPGQTYHPVPTVVVDVLAEAAIPTTGSHSKPWSDFLRSGAPHLDFVISLDAGTVGLHPSWPRQPATVLWNCPAILSVDRGESDRKSAVLQTLYTLHRRLELLVALPMHGADRSALRSDIRDMAHMV